MFGFGKTPLDSEAFNNVFISVFAGFCADNGRSPSEAEMFDAINQALTRFKAKCSPQQENSIRAFSALMNLGSAGNELVTLAKKIPIEMSKGQTISWTQLLEKLYSKGVLTNPAGEAFLNRIANR